MTALAIKLQQATGGALRAVLREAFEHPERLLSAEQWHAGDVASRVLQEIYEASAPDQQKEMGRESATLLVEWSTDDCPPSKAASSLVTFLVFTTPPNVCDRLAGLVGQHSGGCKWHARLLSLVFNYTFTDRAPSQWLSFNFWNSQTDSVDVEDRFIVWMGMLRADPKRALKVLPVLARPPGAAASIARAFSWASSDVFTCVDELREKLHELTFTERQKVALNSWFVIEVEVPPWPHLLTDAEFEELLEELNDEQCGLLINRFENVKHLATDSTTIDRVDAQLAKMIAPKVTEDNARRASQVLTASKSKAVAGSFPLLKGIMTYWRRPLPPRHA